MSQTHKTAPGGPSAGCDTSGLRIVHGMFRTVFSRATKLVSTADPEDTARVALVADHIDEFLTALHNHHHHEDILWWDLLRQRAPESAPIVDRMQAQHQAVADQSDALRGTVHAWRSNPGEKDALLRGIHAMQQTLFHHLDDEEQSIVPVAGRVMTQPEWDRAHTMGSQEGPRDRLIVQLGYLLRCAPTQELHDALWHSLPWFVRGLYTLTGKKKFEKEWQALYGEE